MNGPFCEVIGCGARSAWRLICEGDPEREEYLCHQHWNYLRARVPDYSCCYVPLEDSESKPGDVVRGEPSSGALDRAMQAGV